MAVSTDAVRVSYDGDGASVAFGFPGQFGAAAELVVSKVSPLYVRSFLQLNLDYAVQGGNGGPGTVVLATPLPEGWRLEIARRTARTQPARFSANQGFPAETIEDRFDALTLIVQELEERCNRALALPPSPGTPTVADLPLGDRANRLLAFDAEGTPYFAGLTNLPTINFSITEFGEQLVQQSSAGQALALIGAQPNLNATSFGAQVVQSTSATALRTLLGIQGKVSLFVTDFGAVEGGAVDCTTAFTQAFAAAGATGGVVIVPPGRWLVSNEAYCAHSGVGLVGYGEKSIIVNGSANKPAITFGATQSGPDPAWFGNFVSDIAFAQKAGVVAVDGNCGLRLAGQGKARISNVEHVPFENGLTFLYDVVKLNQVSQTFVYGCGLSDAARYGLIMANCVDMYLTNCRADANDETGIIVYDSEGLYFSNVSCWGNGHSGFYCDQSGIRLNKNFFFSNCVFDSSKVVNCYIRRLKSGLFANCWFSGARSDAVTTQDGLYLEGDGAQSLTFVSCGFLANTRHGAHLDSNGTAPKNVQFSLCWFGDNAESGFGNGDKGLQVDVGSDGQAIGGSARGNTGGGVQNDSGGTFVTSNVRT